MYTPYKTNGEGFPQVFTYSLISDPSNRYSNIYYLSRCLGIDIRCHSLRSSEENNGVVDAKRQVMVRVRERRYLLFSIYRRSFIHTEYTSEVVKVKNDRWEKEWKKTTSQTDEWRLKSTFSLTHEKRSWILFSAAFETRA